MTIPSFTRLVRFVPRSDESKICIGEPESNSVDVEAALRNDQPVSAFVWSGNSVLSPGIKTADREVIGRLLSPVAPSEVGTIRCLGLNYFQHARELSLDIATVPTVFLKPSAALADPWPAPTILPALTQESDTGDYEAELAVVIGKDCKNVREDEALEYVLGYTACNDVSSRASQFAQSQWCFSKGFDGSCPIGPTIVSKAFIPNPSALRIRGLRNDEVKQDCETDIEKLISFLSQGTTLPAETVIISGTPAGVGVGCSPKVTIREGDEFAVEILPHIGTLFNRFQNEGQIGA